MKNIRSRSDIDRLVERIHKLKRSSQRLWGTMTVEEMLWHLRSQLELALGLRPQTTLVKSYVSLPPFRWLVLYVVPFPKGYKTAREMNVKKANERVMDLETEKRLLLERLQQVMLTEKLCPHPLFGKMNRTLWGRLIWKHMDYHLRQFGC